MATCDVAAWLEEKDRQAQADADRIAIGTLRWAKAAAWIGVVGVLVAIGLALVGK